MNIGYYIAKRIRQKGLGSFGAMAYKIGKVQTAIGVAIMLISCFVLTGFENKVQQKIFGCNGHLQVVAYNIYKPQDMLPVERSTVATLAQDGAAYIQNIQAFANKPALLHAHDLLEGVILQGLDLTGHAIDISPYLVQGTLLQSALATHQYPVLISQSLAHRLNITVGQEVVVSLMQQPPRYRKLQIIGIYTSEIPEIDQQRIFCDLKLLQILNGWTPEQVGGYVIRLKNPQKIAQARHALWAVLDASLTITSMVDQYASLFDWFQAIHRNVVMIMVLILLVGGFTMASVMLIQLIERSRMIGILKALGASPKQIQQIFIWQGLRLLGQALLWGNGLGLGLSWVQYDGHVIPLDPTAYYMTEVPIAFDFQQWLWVNGLTVSLMLGVILVPMLWMSRQPPMKLLMR